MYKLWYDNIKPKYEEKSNLWYMDTDNFSVYIKTKDLNAGYLQKVLKKNLALQITKLKDHYSNKNIKKVIGLMKDKPGAKIMINVLH